jgi:protease I
MAGETLQGMKVAILVTDGFEQVELTEPRKALDQAGADTKAFFDADKPVAAICHGPWMIVEADKARGRRMTSWPSVRTDLRNAGAEVVDQEAVVDGNLVTSRKPDDIPAFSREMIKLFAGARGRRQAA